MKVLTKEEKILVSKVQKGVSKTIFKHKLIDENDKVLLGLSGGKDSLILLEAMAGRRNLFPFKYEIVAVHIHTTILGNEVDLQFLHDFCQKLDIELHIVEISVNFAPDKKSPCFSCSWSRRKALFEFAKAHKCNKLALGHHLDDAVETLLMNMAFNAEISSMKEKVDFFDGNLQIIRPLIESDESILIKYAEIKNYNNIEKKVCPHSQESSRKTVKEIVQIFQSVNKDAKKNIFRSMNKILPNYLPE